MPLLFILPLTHKHLLPPMMHKSLGTLMYADCCLARLSSCSGITTAGTKGSAAGMRAPRQVSKALGKWWCPWTWSPRPWST